MKQMPISTFDKCKNIHNEIILLDKEITDIEKLALEVVRDDCELSFNINVKNNTKNDQKEKEDILDGDGSLSSSDSSRTVSFFGWGSSNDKEDDDDIEQRNFIFVDRECLIALEMLIKIKKDKRKYFVRLLNKAGVNLL